VSSPRASARIVSTIRGLWTVASVAIAAGAHSLSSPAHGNRGRAIADRTDRGRTRNRGM